MAQAEVLPIELSAEDKTRSAFDSLKKNVQGVSSALQALEGAAGIGGLTGAANAGGILGLISKFKALAIPAAVITGVVAAAAATKQWNDHLVAVDRAAQELGLRASQIDAFGRMLKAAGGDAKDAVSALNSLRDAAEAMAKGNRVGSLKELFEINNKPITDATGAVRSLKDAYSDVAELIINATSAADRLHIATLAFGNEAAPAMVRAIMLGATSLDKLKENDAFDTLARKARDFDDLAQRLKFSAGAWVDRLTESIKARAAPVLEWLFDKLNAVFGDAPLKITVNGSGKPTETRKPEPAEKSAFETETDKINKHIAALRADALGIGQTEAAQARLRVEFGLLQAAQRDGTVTQDQIDKYTQLRGQMTATEALLKSGIVLKGQDAAAFDRLTNSASTVAGALDRTKLAFQAANSALQFTGSTLVDIFDKIGEKGTKMADLAVMALQRLKRALLETVISGQGPLAGILGLQNPVQGGTGGLLGALFGGFKAGGGDVAAGRAYVVGEKRPELFIPDQDGTIMPTVPTAAGDRSSIDVRMIINLEGANGDETIRRISETAARRAFEAAVATANANAPANAEQFRLLGSK